MYQKKLYGMHKILTYDLNYIIIIIIIIIIYTYLGQQKF